MFYSHEDIRKRRSNSFQTKLKAKIKNKNNLIKRKEAKPSGHGAQRNINGYPPDRKSKTHRANVAKDNWSAIRVNGAESQAAG